MVNFLRFIFFQKRPIKISLFFILFFLIANTRFSFAQVSSIYTFYQYNETYKPGISTTSTTPASIFNTGWDDNTATYPIPFNFTYNGVLFTTSGTIGVDTDGWLAFSNTAITMTGTLGGGSWVSISNPTGVYLNGTANNNGFAGFNCDLNEQSFNTITATGTAGSNILTAISSFADIQIGTRLSGTGITNGTVVTDFTGTTITMSAAATTTGSLTITPRSSIYGFIRGIAPYRQFVVQWTQIKRFNGSGSDNFNFQMVINEAAGLTNAQTIQAVFGNCTATGTTDLNVQVGLRGASAADFNARKTSTDWSATVPAVANTEYLKFNNAINPHNNLVFNWSPQCVVNPGAAGAISGTNPVCPNTIVNYTLAGVPNANFYTWTYSGSGATFSATTTLPTNTFYFGAVVTAGTITVTPQNLCGSGSSSNLPITVIAGPTAGISYPASSYCMSVTGQIPVSQTGTGGGTYSASPAGLTINAAGAITPSTSTAGVYTITYSFTNGTCNGTATAAVTIVANPVINATASPAIICIGSNAQLQANIAGSGSGYTVNSIAYVNSTPSGSPTTIWNVYTDDANAIVAMPFTFNYFGNGITQLTVSSNGYIEMQTNSGNSFTAQTLPNAATPNNVIALAWEDLVIDPSTHPGANVRFFVNGTTPNRVMVIDYFKLRFLGGTSAENVTGQIKLYESDNHIEIAAGAVNDNGNSYQKTMGIENNTGTVGYPAPGRNNVVWNFTTAEAWSFNPVVGMYTYLWSPATFLSNTTISNPVATAVTTTTAYNVTVTNTVTGCVGTGSVTVTASAALNGTYTVGAAGNFATLTAAVSAYNNLCIGGPVVFSLIDPLYSSSETFPISINSNVYQDAINTLRIQPAAGVNAVISGSLNNNALIRITGKYISINGSNNNTTSRNLSITNTSTTSPSVVLFGSAGAVSVTNAALKNCTITNGSTSSSAIVISDAGVLGNPGYFKNDTIQNNLIQKAYMGIYANAFVAGGNGTGTYISSNDLSVLGANAIAYVGIYFQGIDGGLITGNNIGNFESASSQVDRGVWIASGTVNCKVENNNIHDIKYTGSSGYAGQGIVVSTGLAAANISLSNNMLYNISGDGDSYNTYGASYTPAGIYIFGTGQGGVNIYFNSIYLSGNTLAKTNSASIGIALGDNSSANIKNNIIHNKLGRSTSTGIATIGIAALTSASQFITINNNNYFSNASGTGTNMIGRIGTTNAVTLLNWQTATGQEANGVNILPNFISATDLHLVPATNATLSNLGTPIIGIDTDFDDQTRNGLTPDIGADEWVIPSTGSWVGKTSIDWLVPTNWEANVVPDGSTDITITGGYTYMPTIVTVQAVRGLSMSAPGSPPILTINAGTLQISGTILRSGGSIIGSNGSLEMNGTAAQTLPANLFQTNNLKNLIISNTNTVTGVTLAGTLDIYRSLTFGTAGRILNTGGFLTLKSTATETAWLGQMTASNSITGDATIERYIPNHSKAWQFLSTPITASSPQTVKQAWQEGATTSNGNPAPGYGTMLTSHVTGAATQPTPGFDAYTAVGASIKVYNSGAYTGLTSTAIPISNPKGYFVFVRGDRSVTTSGGVATATVMRTKGTLHTPVNPPVTINLASPGFASVGNPYASAIDFNGLSLTGGVQAGVFYLWDPKLTTGPASAYGYGGFQTFSWNGSSFDVTPGGGSYTGSNRNIESGQGFFVNAPASAGTLSFNETAKVSGSNNVNRMPDLRSVQMRTNMYVINAGNPVLIDGNLVQYSRSWSKAVDMHDAIKMNNSGENLGISREHKILAVERRPLIERTDTLFYNMGMLEILQYEMEFIPKNLAQPGLFAFLEDTYLGTSTAVSLVDTTRISFAIINVPGSFAADRFYLVYRQGKKHMPVTVITAGETYSSKVAKEDLVIPDLEVSVPDINVYPNPVENKTLHVQFINQNAGLYKLDLILSNGIVQPLRSVRVETGKTNHSIHLSHYVAAGLYMLHITGPDNKVSIKTLWIL